MADRQDNSIQQVAEFKVKRGKIYAADGRTVLADNVRRKVAGQTLYFRNYPQRGLAAHIVGYSTRVRSRAGLESSENDFLTGSNTNLSTVLDTAFDKLKGTTVEGNDLHLTLRAGAQRVALQALGGKCGAAVAIEPRTGRLLVSVSSPTYDPNLIENQYNLAARPKFGCPPLLNRAEGTPGNPPSGVYIPGSAFKVVTAAAALDSGRFTVDSTFHDPGYCIEYGKPVYNFADQSGPERLRHRQLHAGAPAFDQRRLLRDREGARRTEDPRLRQALRLLLGAAARDPVQRARGQAGSTRTAGSSTRRTTSRSTRAGLAFGQERLQVTPIQMAMVTATIANGGLLMRPYVVERVVAPDGSTVTKTKPDTLGRAINENTANDLTGMMEAVVTRRNRDRRPDSGHPRRRQDRNRRDGGESRQHDMVHLLRARGQPESRRRRRPRAAERDRRHDGGSDRQVDHGSTSPVNVELP